MFKLVVLSVLIAAASSAPSVLGLGWGGLGAWGGWGGIAAPLVAPVAAAPLVAAPNYRGPLSLAPGQPANIIAADGRPLDTLSVNVDRAAHYTARALDGAHLGAHLLKKRSVIGAPLVAGSLAVSHAGLAVPGPWLAPAPVVAAAPLGLGWRAPVGLVGHGAHLGHLW